MIENARRRFYNNLSPKPRYGYDKQLFYFADKKFVVFNAKYIELNPIRKHYLSIDLDYPGGGDCWMEHNLPTPTLVIINKKNYHAHLHWELKTPVYTACDFNFYYKNKVSYKAINFYKKIKLGYEKLVDADVNYIGISTKNPFDDKNNVAYWSNDAIYDLSYLAEFVHLPSIRPDMEEICYESRHMQLFHIIRKISYQQFKFYNDYESFHNHINELCNEYNVNTIGLDYSERLSNSEVRSISKSISSWTWKHRESLKQYTWNKGIMNFKPIDINKPQEEKDKIIHDRKIKGAYYTHQKRKNNTEEKIRESIKYFKENKLKITKKAIAEHCGISLQNIIKRYKHLF